MGCSRPLRPHDGQPIPNNGCRPVTCHSNARGDASTFNPANLAEGIGHPPDEIFATRRAACRISLAKRR
jgi:hypothetical protein